MTVRVLHDARAAAREAATHIGAHAKRAVDQQGRCTLALAGGSTPREAYEMLAEQSLPWERLHFFWTDERSVAPGHPDSNFSMVQRALLLRVPVPAANVHRIPGELRPFEAAASYTAVLHAFWGSSVPCFDLVLLGLGADAHTASLFPWDPLVLERTQAVGVSAPAVDRGRRISLTLPAINAASEIVLLVCGAGKAAAVQRVLQGALDPLRIPAQGVSRDKSIWLLDQEAASGLP